MIEELQQNILLNPAASHHVPTILLTALPGFSSDPPSTPMIYTRDDVELGEKNILVCHVSGFYPAPVNVSWTKNGQKVTEGTSINDGTNQRLEHISITGSSDYTWKSQRRGSVVITWLEG
uniref:Ig-like domain-containing protein n=1 Tax=Fundulus heteroclitus TaxID=8078 RepID=A0A3Q2R392_FUNHE